MGYVKYYFLILVLYINFCQENKNEESADELSTFPFLEHCTNPTKYTSVTKRAVKHSKPFGEKVSYEESGNLNTKALEEIYGKSAVVSHDSLLARPLRKSFNEGVNSFFF